MDTISNEILIIGIRKKSKAIFEQLFKLYYTDLFRLAYAQVFCKSQADDIVQDVFTRLWDKAETLEIKGSIRAYLLRSVKNACLDYLKHIKVVNKSQQIITESFNYEQTLQTDVETKSTELSQQLRNSLNQLPDQQRKVLELKVYENLSYKEIAEELNVKESTIKTHIKRAYKVLRNSLSITLSFFTFI